MSHIYKKEKCRSMKRKNAEAWKEKMQKHENEKCRRQVNLIGRAKFGNDIKQKSTTGGVYRLFVQRQHDG